MNVKLKIPFHYALFFCMWIMGQSAQAQWSGAGDMDGLNWWLGLKTGLTFSKVKPTEKYSVVDGSNETQASEKEYASPVKNMGETIGMIVGYAFQKNILLTFQPSYSNYKYSYKTSYKWQNSAGDSYALQTNQIQRIGYLDLPLTLMLRMLVGKVEPYAHIGGYYGVFMGGQKKIKYTETLTEAGVTNTSPEQQEVFGIANTMMKSQMGLIGGIGVAYTIQYFRIGLEAAYKQGMYNLTDVHKRFDNSRLVSKFFDVPDDLKMNNIEITVNFYMPVDNLIHMHSSQKGKGGMRK